MEADGSWGGGAVRPGSELCARVRAPRTENPPSPKPVSILPCKAQAQEERDAISEDGHQLVPSFSWSSS